MKSCSEARGRRAENYLSFPKPGDVRSPLGRESLKRAGRRRRVLESQLRAGRWVLLDAARLAWHGLCSTQPGPEGLLDKRRGCVRPLGVAVAFLLQPLPGCPTRAPGRRRGVHLLARRRSPWEGVAGKGPRLSQLPSQVTCHVRTVRGPRPTTGPCTNPLSGEGSVFPACARREGGDQTGEPLSCSSWT